MNKYLYLAVTADEYELPICIETSPMELANKLGITAREIIKGISGKYSGKNKGVKFIKVCEEDV